MKSARLFCATLVMFTLSCRHTTSGLSSVETASCDVYPVPVRASDAQTQTLAETKFSELSKSWGGTGKLIWSEHLGTPESVNSVAIPLELCQTSESSEIFTAVSQTLEKYPEIFHFTAAEWVSSSPKLTCADYKSSNTSIVSIRRDLYAGLKIDGDEMRVSLARVDGKLVINSIIGWYMGEAQPAVVANMKACGTFDKETVYQQLEQQPSPYAILENCIQTGQGFYEYSRANDVVTFLGEPYWTVFRDNRSVTLFKTVMAELEIQGKKSEKIFSDELRQSDTICALDQKQFAGFKIVVDGRSGQVYQRRPGIRDCLTCLQGNLGK